KVGMAFAPTKTLDTELACPLQNTPMGNLPKRPIPSIGTAFAKSISIVGNRHPQPFANPTSPFAIANLCPLRCQLPISPHKKRLRISSLSVIIVYLFGTVPKYVNYLIQTI
ncbi:MAG: hypothetical protein RSC95_07640, partial [Anaerovoracaceae bacterium]